MKNPWFILLLLLGGSALAQEVEPDLRVREVDRLVLTHALVPAGPVPTAFDPNGVYPYMSYAETANRPEPVSYRFVELENEYLKVTVCPGLGGKITSIILRETGEEVLYTPPVIRPVRILPRFYFVAGGIEVSFPISHSPTQNEEVLYEIETSPQRIYVTCGERELRFGMQWSVEYSLGSGDRYLVQRVVMHNPGRTARPWMSWSNAALPSASDTRFQFPGGKVLSHSSLIDTIDWETQGPDTEQDIKEMTGYFWLEKETNAFGVFTSSRGTGLYHVADEEVAPGIKLWSYGTGADRSWATLSNAENTPYIEIQGGPISDQSIKLELEPGQTRTHTEFWLPVTEPVELDDLRVPEVQLRSAVSIPLFPWARAGEVSPWLALEVAFRDKGAIPPPPAQNENCWAPSGMDQLAPAFEWALSHADEMHRDSWRFYYGSWLAGRGDTTSAARQLSACKLGLARALQARLFSMQGRYEEAAVEYRKIEEPWLQLHPQVVAERDKILRKLGPATLEERAFWLNQVSALPDEWVVERRVQLLIDQNEVSKARELLLSTSFQKVHQTYSRTALWFQICDRLDEPRHPVPEELGEDHLAGFGAYREFE